MGQTNFAKKSRKKQKTNNNKNEQTNPGKRGFLKWSPTIKFKITSLPKSAGKQSHKAGCPQEALSLVKCDCFGTLLGVQRLFGLLKLLDSSLSLLLLGWFA